VLALERRPPQKPLRGPADALTFGAFTSSWEGDTLVVETTNFSPKADYRGSGENLHLVERFTRVSADTIHYEFTVDDPTTWTKPWTAAIPMTTDGAPDHIFEYACHEGHYGMGKQLQRLTINRNGLVIGRPASMLSELGLRFRNVRQGPDGFLYVLTEMRLAGNDDVDGAVLRIEPA
jgi:hypothetical protein